MFNAAELREALGDLDDEQIEEWGMDVFVFIDTLRSFEERFQTDKRDELIKQTLYEYTDDGFVKDHDTNVSVTHFMCAARFGTLGRFEVLRAKIDDEYHHSEFPDTWNLIRRFVESYLKKHNGVRAMRLVEGDVSAKQVADWLDAHKMLEFKLDQDWQRIADDLKFEGNERLAALVDDLNGVIGQPA